MMKKETFEKAKELEVRIAHISELIDLLSAYDYKLEPPTRQSNFEVCETYNGGGVVLNEGELVFIRKALEDEKFRLQQEFVML